MKNFNDKNRESRNRTRPLVKYLIIFLVLLAIAIYIILQVSRLKTPQYFFKTIEESVTSFAVNGSTSNSIVYGWFMEVNTSATPIPLTINKTSLVLSFNFMRSVTLPGLNYSYISSAPVITPNGFNGTIIRLFSVSPLIGSGNNFVAIYTDAHNFTIYTNGVDYVLENGTWDIYGFAYANLSSLRLIYPVELYPNLSDVAVPENSSVFPTQFLPYLQSLLTNPSLHFAHGDTWWYTGRSHVRVISTPLPPNYTKWG
jgi:hypothetical protein